MSTDPLFMKVGSEYYWYHNDHLRTPQMMTTSSGAIVWSAKYTSFLEATVDASSVIENNLIAPGQYFDTELGFHYNLFRYYDPKSGRYLRSDPIGHFGGINYFLYANSNPLSYADPYGLKGIIEWILRDKLDASKPGIIDGILSQLEWGENNMRQRIEILNKVIKYHEENITQWYDSCLNKCLKETCQIKSDKCRSDCWDDYNKDWKALVEPYVQMKARLLTNHRWLDKWMHYSAYDVDWD